MPATYCEHGYLVEGSRHECAQCTEPVRRGFNGPTPDAARIAAAEALVAADPSLDPDAPLTKP